jgi:hypothetical protein
MSKTVKCDVCEKVSPNIPNAYNCELGGDCSKDLTWTKERCKVCGTVPCPDCQKPEPSEFTKYLRRIIADCNKSDASPVWQCLKRKSEQACDIIDSQKAELDATKKKTKIV